MNILVNPNITIMAFFSHIIDHVSMHHLWPLITHGLSLTSHCLYTQQNWWLETCKVKSSISRYYWKDLSYEQTFAPVHMIVLSLNEEVIELLLIEQKD